MSTIPIEDLVAMVNHSAIKALTDHVIKVLGIEKPSAEVRGQIEQIAAEHLEKHRDKVVEEMFYGDPQAEPPIGILHA